MELRTTVQGKGWRNVLPADSVRHSLAAKGIRTTKRSKNRRLEKLKELSDNEELNWESFRELFLEEAEDILQEYFENGIIEIDADEADPEMRQRYNETRVEKEEEGNVKQYSVFKDTPITFVGEEE